MIAAIYEIARAIFDKYSKVDALHYNNLLTDYVFYQAIHAKYMMTVQMDNIFRKQLPQTIFVGV